MTVLDGKKTASTIKDEIKLAVDELKLAGKRVPHLAAVLVGNDGASLTYVANKVRSCEFVGFESTLIRLEETISEDHLLKEINQLNENETIDGYINIAAAGQVIWKRFCTAMDSENWVYDKKYATPEARSKNRDSLNLAISEKTKII